MAKILKLSGYIVDPDEFYNKGRIQENIDGTIFQHFHVEEADIPNWNDEHPLNYDNCDLAECEKYFPHKYPNNKTVCDQVIPGKTYRHFKGKIVKVLHVVQDTEAPGQFYVIYRCEDGAIWARPYGMFVSDVDKEKYPDVEQEKRFELIEDKPTTNAEIIRNMTDDELAGFLCDISCQAAEPVGGCLEHDGCTAGHLCSFAHNGFKDWVKEDSLLDTYIF